jgi:hypothetical protein
MSNGSGIQIPIEQSGPRGWNQARERHSVKRRYSYEKPETHKTVNTGINDGDLDLNGHGLILALLYNLFF